MKKPGVGGEQNMLAQLLGDQFRAGGLGFFRRESDRPEHRAAVLSLLEWTRALAPGLDLLVLDEALYALGNGLLLQGELEALLVPFSTTGAPHLVLSGRGLPPWLLEKAQLVSELMERKHPASSGVAAQKGIEF
jgi:cob(I)alamin adenosyltransferase